MRLKSLKVAEFRGFNKETSIEFDERLTLVSAPNSHGKTSITEALEFLLFGQTTKVAHADSKEEYRDSYRNRHFPDSQSACIEATFENDARLTTVTRIELALDGTITRYFDGTLVEAWPFSPLLRDAAPPFVLQHALKNLLLVAPTERFQGFAQLLGLYDVDAVQRALVSLCTKPEANIPVDAKRLLADLRSLDERVSDIPSLKVIGTSLRKGAANVETTYKKIHERAEAILGAKFQPPGILNALEAARADASAKVYDGSVAILATTPPDMARAGALRQKVEGVATRAFIESYVSLGARDVLDRLKVELSFLGLGVDLAKDDQTVCPFCRQALNTTLLSHISERHHRLGDKLAASDAAATRSDVRASCISATASAEQHFQVIAKRGVGLIAATSDESKSRVQGLFGPMGDASWKIVEAAGSAAGALISTARQELTALKVASDVCVAAIDAKGEEITNVEELAMAAGKYLAAADAYAKRLEDLEPALAAPDRTLHQAVDALAGTSELALLIELLEKRRTILKALKIQDAVDGLKDLKKHVEQSIGETMEAAIGTDLTGTVMGWYEKIRTKGDPDVHFSGFAMERTKGGDFKSKKVKVAAKSYGKELASAVSSLSESKLNALGLCVSIATTLRSAGPWKFLILDDPIQSWDEDHEIQFIEVLRSLVEQEGKQIILLSHRRGWMNQVALTCRSLNGLQYEFTGYTVDGPQVHVKTWAAIDDRLRTALAIANDPQSSSVRLQQAEEEIRIAACQIVSDIAHRKLARERGAHNLNARDCRTILVDAACSNNLTDRVIATFGTTDDAHHAPKDYEPNAERIRQYHGTLSELKTWAA